SRLETALPQILSAVTSNLRWDVAVFWVVAGNEMCCRGFQSARGAEFPQFQKACFEVLITPGRGLPGRIWFTQRLISLPNIAETDPDAIFSINEDSIILSANPAVERIFGYAPQELIGQSLTRLMPPEQATAHRAGLLRYLESSQKRIPWHGVILPAQRKDGK